MAEKVSLFESIFDGPDSLFGRIFGPRRNTLNEKPRTRVHLNEELIAILRVRKSLFFSTPENRIEIVLDSKPTKR
jgi:hypothetical protein